MLTVEKRRAIERSICDQFISDCISAGYSITVDNGEEEVLKRSVDQKAILDAMFSVDEEILYVCTEDARIGAVHLVYGNDGHDVIADYTVKLADMGLMKGAEEVADKEAEKL